MDNIYEYAKGKKQLQSLIDFALREGWEITRTRSGHLRFTRPGMPPVFTGFSASDFRATRNARARLLRLMRKKQWDDG